MAQVLKIFNPREKPFGPLSNNYVRGRLPATERTVKKKMVPATEVVPLPEPSELNIGKPRVLNKARWEQLDQPQREAILERRHADNTRVYTLPEKPELVTRTVKVPVNIKQGYSNDPWIIDGKKYNSITNYIYSNILRFPTHQTTLSWLAPQKVHEAFHSMYLDEVDETIKKAISTALEVKFENMKLAQLLLQTGNAKIVYVSENPVLGMGNQNTGRNLYGEYLEQTRHLLRLVINKEIQLRNEKKINSNIYDSYVAEALLHRRIREDGDDLSRYLGMSLSQIIADVINGQRDTDLDPRYLGKKLSDANLDLFERDVDQSSVVHEQVLKMFPSVENVKDMYQKGYLSEAVNRAVEHPTTLVQNIRKNELKGLRLRQLRKRKEIMLDMYMDYVLEKDFEDVDQEQYKLAKEQQLKPIAANVRRSVEDQLYDLYNQGMLSARLSDRIEEILASLRIPTEEEVEQVEKTPVVQGDKIDLQLEPVYQDEQQGEQILVYPLEFAGMDTRYTPYVQFSPISYTGMLEINGHSYPTVSQYTTAALLLTLPSITSIPQAFSYLLVNPDNPVTGIESFLHPDKASEKYSELRDKDFHDSLRYFARMGMNTKFEDYQLQTLLVSTGDMRLVYTDSTDPILGVGPKGVQGGNFVGKYLMELRTKYTEIHSQMSVGQLSVTHISTVLDSDPFMSQWVRMRVRDMTRVINIIRKYLYARNGQSVQLSTDLTKNVLDILYQPCSQIYGLVDKLDINTPDYFSRIVRGFPGFQRAPTQVIRVMWERICIVIYHLIQNLNEHSALSVRKVLAQAEFALTKRTDCILVLEDKWENCILSALLNLLNNTNKLNHTLGHSVQIGLPEIESATSIILDADVSEKIQATPKEEIVEEKEFIFPGEEEKVDTHLTDRSSRIRDAFQGMDGIEDAEMMAGLLDGAIELVKTYPRTSREVKNNRVHFFSTQR